MNSKLNCFKISICYILCMVFIGFGIIAVYLIHNDIKYSTLIDSSTLGNLQDVKSINIDDKHVLHTIEKNRGSVLSIYANTTSGLSQGSGFIYNNDGYIITNAHVIKDSKSVSVKLMDSSIYEGIVVEKSPYIDIALIKVPSLKGTSPLHIDKNYSANIGDKVITIGTPLNSKNKITKGIISDINRNFNVSSYKYNNMYQITAPIDNGSSGGPLISIKTGKVIGITSVKAGESHIGFAIPIHQAINYIDKYNKK